MIESTMLWAVIGGVIVVVLAMLILGEIMGRMDQHEVEPPPRLPDDRDDWGPGGPIRRA